MPCFGVIQALTKTTGCALCALETKSLKRYFGASLYKIVNDPKVGNELAQSKGVSDCHSSYWR